MVDTGRSRQIVRVGTVGVIANLALSLLKAAVGLLSNSIAVLLDAVNNLTDAFGSALTIIGTKLAGKRPNREHPYGYGRIEDITSLIIAVTILVAGIVSFKGSLDKVLEPEPATYSAFALVAIAIAVVGKFLLGRYIKKKGKLLNSESLVASGTDATLDSVISLSTLIAAIISMVWGISVEGYLGMIISVVIFKAGIDILLRNLNRIIGVRADSELSRKVRARVADFDEVLGAYDLILNQYGPENTIGSIHIEVDDDLTAKQIQGLSRRIAVAIFQEFGIILTVGINAANTKDPESARIKESVNKLVEDIPEVLQMHGFYVDEDQKVVTFDLVTDFAPDAEAMRNAVVKKLGAQYPDYRFGVFLDGDYSD